jgi:hypothetical protein
MDTNLQYSYQIADLKTMFQIDFGNIIREIVSLLTYSGISADTKTFDDEELKYKLRAAIGYALALLASTLGYSMSAKTQRDVQIAKESLKTLFDRIVTDPELTYPELLDIYFALIQVVSIILNYGTPIPQPRTGNYEIT